MGSGPGTGLDTSTHSKAATNEHSDTDDPEVEQLDKLDSVHVQFKEESKLVSTLGPDSD